MANNNNNNNNPSASSGVPQGFHSSSAPPPPPPPPGMPPQANVPYGAFGGNTPTFNAQHHPGYQVPPHPHHSSRSPYRNAMPQQQRGYSPSHGALPPPPQHHQHSHLQHHPPPRSYPFHQQHQQPHPRKRPWSGSQQESPQRHKTTHSTHPTSAAAEASFHCDACDLTLPTQSALAAHQASHVTCQKCSFSAAPKVVKAHFEAAHGRFAGQGFKTITVNIPGCPIQRFRICVGNRPEDIAEWIKQRKKRFPRQHRQVEKPKLDQHQFTTCGKKEEEDTKPSSKQPSSSLSTLLEGYGSSSSSDNEGDVDEPVDNKEVTENDHKAAASPETKDTNDCVDKKADQDNSKPQPRGICHAFAKHGQCRRGARCPYLHCEDTRNDDISTPHYLQSLKDETMGPQSSLLQKLLRKERERETCLTLNLLKYIVDSNFLMDAVDG